MLPGNFDHFVKFGNLHECFAETVHRVGKFCTFFIDFLVYVNYLLIKNLIALSKSLHFTAKDCTVLLDLDVYLTIESE